MQQPSTIDYMCTKCLFGMWHLSKKKKSFMFVRPCWNGNKRFIGSVIAGLGDLPPLTAIVAGLFLCSVSLERNQSLSCNAQCICLARKSMDSVLFFVNSGDVGSHSGMDQTYVQSSHHSSKIQNWWPDLHLHSPERSQMSCMKKKAKYPRWATWLGSCEGELASLVQTDIGFFSISCCHESRWFYIPILVQ